MGLIDVVMAIAILLLVLIPAALLLSSINASSGDVNHRLVALGIASSYIDEIQGLQSAVPPGGEPPANPNYAGDVAPYNGYFGSCTQSGTAGCVLPWPSTTVSGNFFPTQLVDGLTYSLQAAGGYCQLGTTNGVTSWVEPGTPSTNVQPTGSGLNVYGFFIAVRVSWGNGSQNNQGSVTQIAPLLPPGGATWPTLAALNANISPGVTPGCPTNLS